MTEIEVEFSASSWQLSGQPRVLISPWTGATKFGGSVIDSLTFYCERFRFQRPFSLFNDTVNFKKEEMVFCYLLVLRL